MPTYQYQCADCGQPHEAVQSFSDDPLTVCPSCSGKLRKVFSAVGIVFKGSGFYRTDSRSSGSSGSSVPAAKSESSTSEKGSSDKGGSSTGSEGTKSDSKPAASSGSGSVSGSGSTSASSTSGKAAAPAGS